MRKLATSALAIQMAILVLGIGVPAPASPTSGVMFRQYSFEGGTSGWTGEGDGILLTSGRRESTLGGTLGPPDGSERALRISSNDGPFVARSPVVPADVEHFVWHFEVDNSQQLNTVMEARGPSNEIIFGIGTYRGEFFVSGISTQWLGLVGGGWHRIDVERSAEHFTVTIDNTLSALVQPSLPVVIESFVARPSPGGNLWLDDIRYHSGGSIREDLFLGGAPAAGFESVSIGGEGFVSYFQATASGFYEKGYASIGESIGSGDKSFVACGITDLSTRVSVGIGFKPLAGYPLDADMAILAGLDGGSGDGDVLWAVVLRPVVSGSYALHLITGEQGTVPLPGIPVNGRWHSLRAAIDLETGRIELSWDGGHLTSTSTASIGSTQRVAVGDVFGGPAYRHPLREVFVPDSHPGIVQFDDFTAVSLP